MGASAEQYYVQNSLGTCKVGGSTGEATARTDDAAKSRRKTTSRSTINPKKRGGQSRASARRLVSVRLMCRRRRRGFAQARATLEESWDCVFSISTEIGYLFVGILGDVDSISPPPPSQWQCKLVNNKCLQCLFYDFRCSITLVGWEGHPDVSLYLLMFLSN